METRAAQPTSGSVVCIGELLWDIFPDGHRLLGGAIANVTYHLKQLGVAAQLISRVGSDELGANARTALTEFGIPTLGLQIDPDLPTGSASIEITSETVRYNFVTPAAWDAIEPSQITPEHAVVFGTLAQRDRRTRAVVRALAASASERVYDINLRPPYTPISLVAESLELATLVKMNEEEAAILAHALQLPSEPKAFSRSIMERFGPRAVCVTRGQRGAWIAAGDQWVESDGTFVQVCDTIGAGDAFLAALVAGLLAALPWQETVARAIRLGAWVASARGAMPVYDNGTGGKSP